VLPDEELVRRFRQTGDKACFTELFVRHRKTIFLACRGFFSDSEAAEDATQQTFMRAYQNIGLFEGGDFVNWLRRIGRNVCIDEFRRRHRERQILVPELEEEVSAVAVNSSLEQSFAAKMIW
jgi:RNA polymerase sigma-70 factor (ECF subfamily)